MVENNDERSLGILQYKRRILVHNLNCIDSAGAAIAKSLHGINI